MFYGLLPEINRDGDDGDGDGDDRTCIESIIRAFYPHQYLDASLCPFPLPLFPSLPSLLLPSSTLRSQPP